MKVLVVGSKGFIGCNLYNYFTKKTGIECWGCDVVKDANDLRYIVVDEKLPDFESIFKNIRFDLCINCSGSASVYYSSINTLNDFNLNVFNVVLILEALRNNTPNCIFINLSSAAVYGNSLTLPLNENIKLSPISPYGFHKLISEKVCEEYFKIFNIPTLSIRIFSVYGPGLRKQIFWDWYNKSKTTDLVSLIGTGNESRDFIFIDDLILAIDLIICNTIYDGSCINVGNGSQILIKDLADIFFNILNKSYCFSGNLISADPINLKADISLIQSMGYVSQMSISEGISKYIEWANGLD